MSTHELKSLARLYGIQSAYTDCFHRRRQASPEALLLALRALGAPIEGVKDVPSALRHRRRELASRLLEPVLVAWEGRPPRWGLRLPSALSKSRARCRLILETGETRNWRQDLSDVPASGASGAGAERRVVKTLSCPAALPPGTHRLRLEIGGKNHEALILCAPPKAYPPPNQEPRKAWGVFMPLYAMHSAESWGGGDFSDLETLIGKVAELGGSATATLPILSAFLDEPFEPSPYAPVSRLFWNEFYVSVSRIPELRLCPSARAMLNSRAFKRETQELRRSPRLDYRRQAALKRKVLFELSKTFFARAGERHGEFRRFVAANPRVEDYARFRAAMELRRSPWQQWPAPSRDGRLRDGDFVPENMRYHLYAQWLAHRQLQAVSARARALKHGLYLDLPLGVHPQGYDVWREREIFAPGISGGAPPDPFFTRGQKWGFPPFHPERLRESGYRYCRAYLRNHLKFARFLRIDHVMGLHRLFWVPDALKPADGVYVRYPAEEMYALLSLESHRHRACIIGENLGTVPACVNAAMKRRRIQRMYVLQYQLAPDARKALGGIEPDSVASINTHDMPPFAAFWRGLDIRDRLELGLLDSPGAALENRNRRSLKSALTRFLKLKDRLHGGARRTGGVLKACLHYLSESPARLLLVNLEDLWLEEKPQNVPGTGWERPNWMRKARYALEDLCPRVRKALHRIDISRN